MKWLSRALTTAMLMLAPAAPAVAQAVYPSKTVRMIVGASPGGTTDLIARFFGEFFTRQTGGQVVVENVAGAGGNIASAQVAAATPDGYTLGLVSSGLIVINGALYRNLRFDPVADLVAVAAIADAPQVVVVNADLPAKTFQDFLTLAKAKPGSILYGSAGLGSTPHLGSALLGKTAGLSLVHVPYRGAAPAATDLIAGRIQMMSVAVAPVINFVRSGQLRALAVVNPDRLKELPEVPTVSEAGLPGYSVSNWFGIVAPKGTPRAVVDRINGLAQSMVADPAERKRLEDNLLVPMSLRPDELAALVRTEAAAWARTIADLDIRLD